MMLDNLLVVIGTIFLGVIAYKLKNTIKEIEESKKNIELIFLNKKLGTHSNQSQSPHIT